MMSFFWKMPLKLKVSWSLIMQWDFEVWLGSVWHRNLIWIKSFSSCDWSIFSRQTTESSELSQQMKLFIYKDVAFVHLAGADDSNLLPPIDQDDIDAFEDALAESATPTSAPVLFTYAPSEGKFDQLTRRLGKSQNRKLKRLFHRSLIKNFFSQVRDPLAFPIL